VLQEAPALLVRGRLEAAEGVINIIAQQVAALPVDYSLPSRDFR
jgi:error-prone DNA polymerase